MPEDIGHTALDQADGGGDPPPLLNPSDIPDDWDSDLPTPGTDPQPSALRQADQPNPFTRAEDIPQLLGQLAGAVSMCWDPRPSDQVFDGGAAGDFVNQAMERLGELIDLGPSNNTLERDLARVLNRHNQENRSNTPDHLLAGYLLRCLDAGNALVNRRSHWWGLPTAFSDLLDKARRIEN